MNALTMDLHTHVLEKRVAVQSYWRHVQRKGLDAVAITEHADFRPGSAYRLLLEKKPKNTLLIPGMELNTSIGHVLCYASNAGLYDIRELHKSLLPIEIALDIANDNNFLLSIAHPWGFSYDSAGFILGNKRLDALVERNAIGVEAYNGMIGHLSNFIYDTNWMKKPMNFLDFLEKNKVAKKMRIDRIGKRLKSKLDSRGREVLERCGRAIELGNRAKFITAGSDGHSAARIGAGIMKLRFDEALNNENLLEAVQNKKRVTWFGPYVREVGKNEFELVDDPIKRMEIVQGIEYAAKTVLVKKVRKRMRKSKA